jgi:flagellar protein FlbD
MIKLTRLDKSEIYINPDLIETIEETPDTHITLMNSNRYLVLEKAEVVLDRIVLFKARIISSAKTGQRQKEQLKQSRANSQPVGKRENTRKR